MTIPMDPEFWRQSGAIPWTHYPNQPWQPEPEDPKDSISDEDKEYARSVFAGEAKDDKGQVVLACYYCGGIHSRVVDLAPDWQICCPRVKSMQRDANGVLLGVEFWPPGQWETNVIFPHDVAP